MLAGSQQVLSISRSAGFYPTNTHSIVCCMYACITDESREGGRTDGQRPCSCSAFYATRMHCTDAIDNPFVLFSLRKSSKCPATPITRDGTLSLTHSVQLGQIGALFPVPFVAFENWPYQAIRPLARPPAPAERRAPLRTVNSAVVNYARVVPRSHSQSPTSRTLLKPADRDDDSAIVHDHETSPVVRPPAF